MRYRRPPNFATTTSSSSGDSDSDRLDVEALNGPPALGTPEADTEETLFRFCPSPAEGPGVVAVVCVGLEFVVVGLGRTGLVCLERLIANGGPSLDDDRSPASSSSSSELTNVREREGPADGGAALAFPLPFPASVGVVTDLGPTAEADIGVEVEAPLDFGGLPRGRDGGAPAGTAAFSLPLPLAILCPPPIGILELDPDGVDVTS